MPLPNRTTLFTVEYWDKILERVGNQGKTVRVECGKDSSAMFRLRNSFYRYRRLLHEEGKEELSALADAVMVMTFPTNVTRKFKETYAGAYAISFLPRASLPDNQLLAKALEETDG